MIKFEAVNLKHTTIVDDDGAMEEENLKFFVPVVPPSLPDDQDERQEAMDKFINGLVFCADFLNSFLRASKLDLFFMSNNEIRDIKEPGFNQQWCNLNSHVAFSPLYMGALKDKVFEEGSYFSYVKKDYDYDGLYGDGVPVNPKPCTVYVHGEQEFNDEMGNLTEFPNEHAFMRAIVADFNLFVNDVHLALLRQLQVEKEYQGDKTNSTLATAHNLLMYSNFEYENKLYETTQDIDHNYRDEVEEATSDAAGRVSRPPTPLVERAAEPFVEPLVEEDVYIPPPAAEEVATSSTTATKRTYEDMAGEETTMDAGAASTSSQVSRKREKIDGGGPFKLFHSEVATIFYLLINQAQFRLEHPKRDDAPYFTGVFPASQTSSKIFNKLVAAFRKVEKQLTSEEKRVLALLSKFKGMSQSTHAERYAFFSENLYPERARLLPSTGWFARWCRSPCWRR